MNHVMLTLLLTAMPCEDEATKGPAEKLLVCAEKQSGTYRRYLFARAFYRLGSIAAGDHEAAQIREGAKEEVEAMRKDLAGERKTADQQRLKALKVCASDGGGLSWESLKKLDALTEAERSRLEKLSGAELKVLLHVPQAELDTATEPRGLVVDPARAETRSDSR